MSLCPCVRFSESHHLSPVTTCTVLHLHLIYQRLSSSASIKEPSGQHLGTGLGHPFWMSLSSPSYLYPNILQLSCPPLANPSRPAPAHSLIRSSGSAAFLGNCLLPSTAGIPHGSLACAEIWLCCLVQMHQEEVRVRTGVTSWDMCFS